MAATHWHPLLQQIRRLAGAPSEQSSDGQLLERFLVERDEGAFTTLVRRHGPMVFGLCRRVLRHEQDAEDVFQATFLVLARKAASVRQHRSLGAWLHEVAYHLALRVQENALRRRKHEREIRPMTPCEDPREEVYRRELRSLLDEELRQLPTKYREPLILCYLEGKTNEQAARQLGWPAGSMARRLARGRELLQRRLLRRGVHLSAGMLAAALIEQAASAAVPPLLAVSVVRMVLQTPATGISVSVAALVEGGLREMFLVKLRLFLLLALTTIGVGAGALACQTKAEKPAEHNSSPPPEANMEKTRTDLYGDPLPPGVLMRLGTARLRHRQTSATFSPDGKTVISAGIDMTIRTWDPATGKELRRTLLEAAKPLLNGLHLSADGKTAVGATDRAGQTLYVWDAITGKQRLSIPIENANPYPLALTFDGKMLAGVIPTAERQSRFIHLWDTTSGKVRFRLEQSEYVESLAFSADARLLGAVGMDEKLRIWDTNTGKEIRTLPGASQQLAFSPDGEKVASGGQRGILKIWNVADGKELFTFHEAPVVGPSLAFSPDGKFLAAGGFEGVMLFDVVAGKLVHKFPAGWCNVGFSPDGKTLLASLASANHLWDITTCREITPRPGHDSEIDSLLATPDGKRLFSLSGNYSTIRSWDLVSGKPLSVVRVGPPLGLHTGFFSTDGKRFLSDDWGGAIHSWDPESGRELQKPFLISTKGNLPSPAVLAVGLSIAERRLAALSAGRTHGGRRCQIDTWDTDTGKNLHCWPVEVVGSSACFAPDGRSLAFRIGEGLAVWDAYTNQELARLRGNLSAPFVFSPDGCLLAAASFKPAAPSSGMRLRARLNREEIEAIVLIEMATGQQVLRIETGLFGRKLLTFSSDGRMLATANRDNFTIWDTATGKELFHRPLLEKLNGSRAASLVSSLAFLPGGDALTTGLIDSTILIWDVSPALRRTRESHKVLAPAQCDSLWSDLAGEDAARAYRATAMLAADPAKTISFLKERLRPIASPDKKEVQSLLADLDSPEFTVREGASKKLASFGEQIEPVLRHALASKPSLEMRKRLEALYTDAERASHGVVRSPELLRTLRAIRVLEYIGDHEARQVLQKLAAGNPAARATRQAKEALQRWASRAGQRGSR